MPTFVTGLVLTAYAAWLAYRYGTEPSSYYVGEFIHVGAYLGGGLVAGLVAVGKPIGRRMMLTGAVLAGVAPIGFGITATGAPVTITQTLAVVLIGLQYPAVGQALLTYPNGIVPDATTRWFLRALWSYGAIAGVVLLVTWAQPATGGSPGNAHLIGYLIDDRQVATVAMAATQFGLIPFVLGGTALFVRRLITAGRRERRLLTIPAVPLIATALLSVAWLAASGAEVHTAARLLSVLTYLSAVAVPVSVLTGLVVDRLRQARITALLRGISNARADRLRDEMAHALGDPTLRLAFPSPGGPIDEDGRPVTLPGPAGPYRATTIGKADAPTAWLIHDGSLLHEPELLQASVAACGMALDIARLQTLVDTLAEAQLDTIRGAQRRIVEAQDTARRRIERDLHDGAQQRLLGLGFCLQRVRLALDPGNEPALDRLTEAEEELRAYSKELRDLARGIHPPALITHGLAAALEPVVARHPIPVTVTAAGVHRCDPHVESTAYFVAVEVLANSAKHAGAQQIRLILRSEGNHLMLEIGDDGSGGARPAPGSGLEGLRDRVQAIGGTLTVESPAGTGTTVQAVLPCAC